MAFLLPFLKVLLMILEFVEWIVIAWVIISWLLFFASQTSFRWRYRAAYNILSQLNDICSRMTYPFLRPIRRVLRRWDTAGIDWSPLILLLIIYLIRMLVLTAYNAIVLPAAVYR